MRIIDELGAVIKAIDSNSSSRSVVGAQRLKDGTTLTVAFIIDLLIHREPVRTSSMPARQRRQVPIQDQFLPLEIRSGRGATRTRSGRSYANPRVFLGQVRQHRSPSLKYVVETARAALRSRRSKTGNPNISLSVDLAHSVVDQASLWRTTKPRSRHSTNACNRVGNPSWATWTSATTSTTSHP